MYLHSTVQHRADTWTWGLCRGVNFCSTVQHGSTAPRERLGVCAVLDVLGRHMELDSACSYSLKYMCYCMWLLVTVSSREGSNKSLMAIPLFLDWFQSFS